MAEISPLRRRMLEDMTVRNLSPATQRSYVHALAKFSRYFGRSPDRLGLEEVRAFQVHLVLLRHKRSPGRISAVQQGHRSSRRTRPTTRRRRMVAIEFTTCRSGRTGGRSPGRTTGNGRRFEVLRWF